MCFFLLIYMQCCRVFFFVSFFLIWPLPAPYLMTLIFTLLQLCSGNLKVFSAFTLERHIKQGEFMLRWVSFYVEVRFLLDLFTPDVWKWDHYRVASQSKDSTWWIFHPYWTFSSLHTDVHCFITLFWPVEVPANHKSARKMNLLWEIKQKKSNSLKGFILRERPI